MSGALTSDPAESLTSGLTSDVMVFEYVISWGFEYLASAGFDCFMVDPGGFEYLTPDTRGSEYLTSDSCLTPEL